MSSKRLRQLAHMAFQFVVYMASPQRPCTLVACDFAYQVFQVSDIYILGVQCSLGITLPTSHIAVSGAACRDDNHAVYCQASQAFL